MVRLNWRPELRFFERRTELLRRLEVAEHLAAFRWSEDQLGARLGRSEMLEAWFSGLDLLVATPDGDTTTGEEALAIAMEVIEPERISVREVLFQFLIPIDDEYTATLRRTSRLIAAPILSDVASSDWALLLDGESAEGIASFKVEVGIVNDDEAPARLARRVGRVQAQGVAPVPQDFWRHEDAPQCGLFADWQWIPSGRAARVESVGQVLELWSQLCVETDTMMARLHQTLGVVDSGESGKEDAG